MARTPTRWLLAFAAVGLTFPALACSESPRRAAVAALSARSQTLQVACLDVNGDGRVNAGDADPQSLSDVTGDDTIDDRDLSVIDRVDIALPGRPQSCEGRGPLPDWQITEPANVDCDAGNFAVILLGIGGGAVVLTDLDTAAGTRWMLAELGDSLREQMIPHQIASVAPGLHGAEDANTAAEQWAAAYLEAQFSLQPCLRAVLLGHSHGAVVVTAVTAALERAGFSDRVLLSVLVDRATALYMGDAASIPQQSPVLNFYLPDAEGPHGQAIDQPNVANVDASNELAPAEPLTHTSIDNSEDVLVEIERAVLGAVASR